MGEPEQRTLFRPEFNRAVRVEVARSAVTDDAGALLLRELAGQLGYDRIAQSLLDHRAQHLVTHPLQELLLTRVLLLAQGWHLGRILDRDPAGKLLRDPVVAELDPNNGVDFTSVGGMAPEHAEALMAELLAV